MGPQMHLLISLAMFSFLYGLAAPTDVGQLPADIDWRAKGAITPAQHQGICGSGSIFAALATIEAIVTIGTGQTLQQLSAQDVFECTFKALDIPSPNSCFGCTLQVVFDYASTVGVLPEQMNYTFMYGSNPQCKRDPFDTSAIHIKDYQLIPPNDENTLLSVVAVRPVAALIGISYSFLDYHGGIFDDLSGLCTPSITSEESLTHAVAIVGYGSQDGTDYWIIKNSWGEEWGEDGFMRLRRNVSSAGICGINTKAYFPVTDTNNIINVSSPNAERTRAQDIVGRWVTIPQSRYEEFHVYDHVAWAIDDFNAKNGSNHALNEILEVHGRIISGMDFSIIMKLDGNLEENSWLFCRWQTPWLGTKHAYHFAQIGEGRTCPFPE